MSGNKTRIQSLSDIVDLNPSEFREFLSDLSGVYATLQLAGLSSNKKPSECFPGYFDFIADGKGRQSVSFVAPSHDREG